METYVRELAQSLQDDFDLHVLAHSRDSASQEEFPGNFRLRRCGTWFNALSQPFSPSMASELRRLAPDLVHLNAPNAFATACWAGLARSSRLLITHHADVIGRRVAKFAYQPLYAHAVARARRVIVFSKKNAAASIDLPDVGNRLIEIPQGLDPALFACDETARAKAFALRRSHCGDAPLALFIGRLIGYKGLDVLLKAAVLTPGLHVAIAGDGPLRADLAAQIARAGLGDRVHLLGAVEESVKLQLLQSADLFVLPSVSNAEAFGIVQVEAQMCGLPIVASNLPTGVTDVTVDGQTGLLVPPGDAPALARAMAQIIADKSSAAQMGEAGQRRALERFSRTAFASANRALFRCVAEEA